MKSAVDKLALGGVIFSVAAIFAVVAVSLFSVRNLVAAGERVSEIQRVRSSLEALRFAAMTLDTSQQAYVITGNEEELASMRTVSSMMRAELSTLSKRRVVLRTLREDFELLQQSSEALIVSEKKTAELRRKYGFGVAQAKILRQDEASKIQAEVLALIYRMIVDANTKLDQLEVEQDKVSSSVQTWLAILMSIAGLVLVIIYVSLRRMGRKQADAQAKIAYQAAHDSLTGLHNRQAVIDHLNERFANTDTERAFGGFGLMLIDLDGFKAVNDQWGHDAGDALLQQASTRMQRLLRDSDFLARLGGDEFLVVLPQLSDRETAALVGAKLTTALAEPYALPSGEMLALITASIGVSFFPNDGVERESLMRLADAAMYAAKRAGRNRVAFSADLPASTHP